VRGNICCPLDNVFGGTWIGVNNSGIFCAITNWDLEENFHGRGLKSRGLIVSNTLNCTSTEDILKYWSELEAKNHKPFNIIAGDINNLYHLSNDNKEMILTKLEEGLHISTGIGFNQPVPRDTFIRKNISQTNLLDIMGSHDCGIGSEDSVCVHDQEHRWETVSTSLIFFLNVDGNRSWIVMFKDGPGCSKSQMQTKQLGIL
jgi:hypothetical protein